jgi:hypothetical protein
MDTIAAIVSFLGEATVACRPRLEPLAPVLCRNGIRLVRAVLLEFVAQQQDRFVNRRASALQAQSGGAKCWGTLPVSDSRKATMAAASCSLSRSPNWTSAMIWTASSSLATEPSWK